MGDRAVECPIHELFHFSLLIFGWVHYESEEVQIVLKIVPDEPGMREELLEQPAVLVDSIQGILTVRHLFGFPRIVLEALYIRQRDQCIVCIV